MSRTAAGALAAIVVLAGLLGATAGPVGAQSAENETTVNCSFPLEVTDATGATVTVEEEPERLVALAPSAAQVLWEIGAQDDVVGMPVQYHTEYLNGSTEKTNVVNKQGQPQREQILDAEPDLVLAPSIVSEDTVQRLRDVDLTVYRYDQEASIEDVVEKTRLTGRLVGEYDTAREVSARTKATLSAYQAATKSDEQPTVLYALGTGYTAGPDTFIGDVIDAAGGDNIASAANISKYKTISNEVIVKENPDWIVVPSGIDVPSGPDINDTTAIQEDQILRVDRNFMNQPGPRVIQPLERMATAFHSEATAEVSVDPSTVTSPPCAVETQGPETTATDRTITLETNQTEGTLTATQTPGETTTTSGPGFGVLTAMLALLGAGTVARRR